MSDPDWFLNLIIWYIYGFLQGICINWIGFWFAIFADYDWGRVTMVGLHESLNDNDSTLLEKFGPEIEAGSYGA